MIKFLKFKIFGILITTIVILFVLPQLLSTYYQHKAEDYSYKKNYIKAEDALNKELIIKNWTLGDNDKEIARILNFLGDMYALQGNYKAAYVAIEKAHIYEIKIGQVHQVDLAKEYIDLEKDLSLSYINKMNSKKKLDKEINSNICKIVENSLICVPVIQGLSEIYLEQHRYAEAERFYKRILQELKSTNSQYLNVQIKLASLYMSQGEYNKALDQLEIILKNKNLYPDMKAYVIHNKAKINVYHKKYAKAEELYEKSILIYEKINNHKNTDFYNQVIIPLKLELNDVYITDHKYTKSENYLRRILSEIKVQPYYSWFIQDIYGKLALICEKNNRNIEAETFYKKGIDIEKGKQIFKNNNSLLLIIKLSKLYFSQKKYSQAIDILNNALIAIEKNKFDRLRHNVGHFEKAIPYSAAIESYKALNEVYKSINKPELANYYEKKYTGNLEIYNNYYTK